ncbi:MAG: tRNA pseudouridine(38-40) synthase TruA [Eubacterium sp.]|nr:tRNA pseudouridine(38-40) synthase TruA [Eubacterium sp.]
MKVKLTVAYDGTNYHGWQIQNNALSVEEVLTKALRELLGEETELTGASRTDAGVHALGNVAVFDTNTRIPAEKIAIAVNQRLPEDIRVMRSEEVPQSFHPRYCASRKTYEYRITNAEIQQPVKRLYSHFVYIPLNVERMKETAKYFCGEHDFAGFCSAGSQVRTTVRTIDGLQIVQEDEDICIRITGNGFLYNMVRIIAGTLIEIGMGRREPETVCQALRQADRSLAGPTAPARGLRLIQIEYEENRQEYRDDN